MPDPPDCASPKTMWFTCDLAPLGYPVHGCGPDQAWCHIETTLAARTTPAG